MGNKEYKSSVQSLLFVLAKKLWLIVLISVAVAAAAAAVTEYLIPPVYSSSAKFYVYNDSSNNSSYITSSDINAAQSLVDTYIVIINSDTVLERVAQKAEVSYTPKQLHGKISAGSLSGTEAFYVSVSSTSKSEALKIAQAIVDVVPDTITDVVKAGGVSVIDYPKLADSQDSPNVRINVLIAFIAGFVISFSVFFLREVTDNTVYSEEDLKNLFSYPVIGQIPEISSAAGSGQGTGYASKSKNAKKS